MRNGQNALGARGTAAPPRSVHGPRGLTERLESRTFLNAVPVGPDFLVNTTTLGDQLRADVATDPQGDSVVAWATWPNNGAGTYSLLGQRFGPTGARVGGEFP